MNEGGKSCGTCNYYEPVVGRCEYLFCAGIIALPEWISVREDDALMNEDEGKNCPCYEPKPQPEAALNTTTDTGRAG